MDVLQETVTLVLFPPNLYVNEESIHLRDQLKGYGAGFYNELLYYSQINATFVPTPAMGGCTYSETLKEAQCTDLTQLLYSGEANMSLMPVTSTYDQRMEAPFEVAFPIFDQQATFVSTAISNGTEVELHILSTAIGFNKILLASYLCFYAVLLLLINWSGNKSRFMGRLKWPDAFQMIINAPSSKSFLAPHRRVAFLVAVLLTFMYYQMYMGSMQTALVVHEPETYLQTLAEIDQVDHRLVIMKGLAVDNVFSASSDPVMKRLYERAEKLSPDGGQIFNEFGNRMKDDRTIIFCDTIALCGITQGFFCINTDCDPRKRIPISASFAKTSPLLVFSRGADRKLKHRFRRTIYWFVQSGVYDLFNNEVNERFAPLVASYESKFRMCMSKMNRKKSEDSEVPAVSLYTFQMIFRVQVIFWPLALFCLCFECLSCMWKSKSCQKVLILGRKCRLTPAVWRRLRCYSQQVAE